jgi:hypothetical protein
VGLGISLKWHLQFIPCFVSLIDSFSLRNSAEKLLLLLLLEEEWNG